jgi:Ca2+/Na+ antiporter
LTIPIVLIIIFICFYILGSTADDYLSPALAKISMTFKLSESLAGVTLLALGNGAPDVITALAASGSDDGGIFLAVGALMGGGLFISGIVSAVVMFSADKPIHLLGRTLTRDIVFYLVALMILLSASFIGEMHIGIGIGFLALYVIYVLYVVIQDKIDERIKKRHQRERKSICIKRESDLRLTEHEQNLIDMQDVEEDAYLIFDEDDHLVDVEIKIVNGDDDDSNRETQFKRLFGNRATNYNDPGVGLQEIDAEERRSSQNLKPINNSTLLSNHESQEVDQFFYKTKVEKIHSENVLNKTDSHLSDFVRTVKIDKSRDISSALVKDYIDDELEHPLQRSINEKHQLTKTKSKIEQTRVKVVWSMLKMKRFFIQGVETETPFRKMS